MIVNKYIKGEQIKSIDEIIEIIKNKENVFFYGLNLYFRNYAWLGNQQFHWLLSWLERGSFYKTIPAVSKTINKGIYPTKEPADKFINLLIIKDIELPVGIVFDELPYLKEVHIIKSKNKIINYEYVDSIIKQCRKHDVICLTNIEVDEIERK